MCLEGLFRAPCGPGQVKWGWGGWGRRGRRGRKGKSWSEGRWPDFEAEELRLLSPDRREGVQGDIMKSAFRRLIWQLRAGRPAEGSEVSGAEQPGGNCNNSGRW